MASRIHLLTFIILVAVLCSPAWGAGLTARMTSRMTTQAISKAVSHAFKPKLTVKRNQLGSVSALTLSSDQNLLAVGMDDGSVRVWDLINGQQWAAYGAKQRSRITCVAADSQSGQVASADEADGVTIHSFGNDPRRLALGGPVLSMGYTGTGELVGVTKDEIFKLEAGSQHITPLHKFTSSLRQAAITDRLLVILDKNGSLSSVDVDSLVKGKYVSRKLHGKVKSMSVSDDGKITYAQIALKRVVALRNRTGQPLGSFKMSRSIHMLGASSNGLVVADGSADLRFYPLDGEKTVVLGELEQAPTALLVDQAGNYLVTGSSDGTLQLWSVSGRKRLAKLISTRKGWAVVDEDGRFTGTETALNDIAWTGDGSTSVSVGSVSPQYYEPGLLSKALEGEQLSEVAPISEGLTLPPKVEIQAQANGESATVTVRGIDNKGGGVSDLRLYQNGKRVSETSLVESSGVDGDGRKLEIKKVYSIPVLPRNHLAAVAVNARKVESEPSTLVLDDTSASQKNDRALHIMTIGINEYDDSALKLVSASTDADSIDSLFLRSQNPYRYCRHYVLRDKGATTDNIKRQFSVLRDVAIGDAVMIYLTGHGLAHDGEWYFLPRNITLEKLPGELAAQGIPSAYFQKLLTDIPADQIFLVIDSCQAGGVLPPSHRFAGLHALRTMSRLSGVHVLAATNKDQDALEVDSLGHGLLTYAFLQGASGKADYAPTDDNISVREVMDYSVKVVPLLSKKYGKYNQYPTVFSRGYDFYLVSR